MSCTYSINLGDVFCGLVVVFLMCKGQPQPAVVLLLCLVLPELKHIRREMADRAAAQEAAIQQAQSSAKGGDAVGGENG